jgi:hypothetical protein
MCRMLAERMIPVTALHVPTIDTVNLILHDTFGKQLYRVRASNGVVRYAIGPEFALVWSTFGEAWEDLKSLSAFQ